MIDEDILRLFKPIIDCLVDLNISYYIGGSIASSAYGFLRTTADIDLGTEITDKHVHDLVKRLEKDYFIQESAIRDAIQQRRSFNIIHLETVFKIEYLYQKDALLTIKRIYEKEERPWTKIRNTVST